ncbi:MAG: Alpha-L-Rha alpha-1,3-L-rhamnosyltransferase [Holophagaceae bacterium]|nr:Alpha-L-Rha alpha-1,3-L-rhamnosyltransferase [Holophagaceae bacterium]
MSPNYKNQVPTENSLFSNLNREPTISVAMCTFNGANYIGEQLESIATQSCPPMELIICDDCSSDGTMAILENFATTVPFQVRLFRNETNLGSNQNFEKAISLCQGDIIVLADQDDAWMPHKLEITLSSFKNHPTAVAMFSDAALMDQHGVPMGSTMWEALRFSPSQHSTQSNGIFSPIILLTGNVITGATMAFRSIFRPFIGTIPPGFVHDYWIALAMAHQGEIVMVDTPLIHYRQHPGQQIGAPRIKPKEPSHFRWGHRNRITRWREKHQQMTKMHNALSTLLNNLCITENKGPAFLQFSMRYHAYLSFRLELSPRLSQRIWPILRELLLGNYHLNRKPFKCVLQDLVVTPKSQIRHKQSTKDNK